MWFWETNPRPFSEKLKLSISLDQESKVSYGLFLLYAKGYGLFLLYAKPKAIEIIETTLQTTRIYLILSFFKKQKEVWN